MLGQIIQLLHQLALEAFGLLLAVLCGAPQTPPEPPAAPEQAQIAPIAGQAQPALPRVMVVPNIA